MPTNHWHGPLRLQAEGAAFDEDDQASPALGKNAAGASETWRIRGYLGTGVGGGSGRVWLTAVPGRMGWPLLPSCKKAKRGPGHRVGAGRMGALNSSLLSLDRFLKSGG